MQRNKYPAYRFHNGGGIRVITQELENQILGPGWDIFPNKAKEAIINNVESAVYKEFQAAKNAINPHNS